MVKTSKLRVDFLLVKKGMVDSREKAKALVMAGKVFTGTRRLDKPGEALSENVNLSIKAPTHPWVSRGGVKLAHALDHFQLNVSNAVALDIGASTGGFTEVLLKEGARRVYSVDVGHGQLAWKLRKNPSVVVLERTNARYLDETHVPDLIDVIVCDVSFIGLKMVFLPALRLVGSQALFVGLIKPQFEVGPSQVGKRGVVRDPRLHSEVCEQIKTFIDSQPGWVVIGLTESPIKGPEGNHEFLIAARLKS